MENGAANSVDEARLDCETLAEDEDEDAVIFRCDTLTDWGFGDFHCDSLAAEFAHGQAQQKVFGHGVPEAEKFRMGETAEDSKLDMDIAGNETSSYRVAENGSSTHEEAVNLRDSETEHKNFSRDGEIFVNELSSTSKPYESVREVEHTGVAFVTDAGFEQGVKIESCVEARQEEDFEISDDVGSPGDKDEGDLSLHDSHRNSNEEYDLADDIITSVALQSQRENSDLRLTEEDDHRSHNTVAVAPFEGSLERIADTRADTVQEEEGVKDGWEAARAWLWTLPRRRNVLYEEMEEWLQINKRRLSREIVTMPRGLLFRFLVSQHKLMRRTEQMENLEVLEPPTARFRRSDKWKPVYAWLETLDSGSVVGAKAIDAWLSRNPGIKDDLLGKHTRHHLFHYIQKCHTNIIKKKKRELLNGPVRKNEDKKRKRKRKALMRVPQKSGVQLAAHGFAISRTDAGASKNVHDPADQEFSSVALKASDVNTDSNIIESRQTVFQAPMDFSQDGGNAKVIQEHRRTPSTLKEEARRKYEILSELQAQLLDQILQARDQLHIAPMNEHTHNSDQPSTSAAPLTDGSVLAGNSAGVPYFGFDGLSEDVEGRLRRRSRDFTRPRSSLDMRSAKRRRKGKEKLDNAILSWSYGEVLTGSSNGSRPGFDSHSEKGPPLASTSKDPSLLEQATSQTSGGEIRQRKLACSPVRCLQEREIGANAGSPTSPFLVLGKGRWKSFFEGWSSLERQFTGCSSWLQRRLFSSWLPCWSAYTSSVAVALPLGMVDQGVQKVLDVRFHPQNNAQLVCSSNAAPNELLLYDLLTGKVTELAGHNCQIQAVEYAARGERIISCGSNLLKIWDSTTGTCLHTLGPGPWDENASGHKKKINAMAINQDLPYLVATSGGQGDSQVLLWNINRGELVCDLNGELRNHFASLPCMDALEFCNQNILICGSDSSGGPAIVQIWDVQAPQNVTSFPANESYITSLNVDPAGQVIASGAGDGSVALSDVRTCAGIVRLPLGSGNEVTSVSFSSCGRYLQASSTANRTFVWDMRILPMDPGPRPTDNPLPLTDNMSRKARSLHCLSHGAPMPTSENAGQMPGFVDEGDQGVNDARWFHNESVLVTVSGNGSIAMWDMTLGDPCIQHTTSHSRCINTVAVSPNDKYICSGGDDQKVVLYYNTRDKSSCGWRLTHPLLEEATSD